MMNKTRRINIQGIKTELNYVAYCTIGILLFIWNLFDRDLF